MFVVSFDVQYTTTDYCNRNESGFIHCIVGILIQTKQKIQDSAHFEKDCVNAV